VTDLAVALQLRQTRARERMRELGVDALLLSVGADLPYLTGYEAMPLERLTMLVVPREGGATLVVPELEAPRVELVGDAFALAPWGETADPVREVAALVERSARTVAIGDQTWARFVLALQEALPETSFVDGRSVMAPLRVRKDAAEVKALRAAALAVDAVVAEMRERPFGGRREIDVHRELVDRMLEHGHQRANFAIVGSGPNGASPHHDASDRVIASGDLVVCDFGGAMRGYCSDITRVFAVDAVPTDAAEAYEVLRAAQSDAVAAAKVGTPCEDVDAAARSVIDAAGYGERFIHRTGHGIGLDAHEDPYIVAGNEAVLEEGHAFSVEPGIYCPGRWGMRLEDIVVATANGPDVLNTAPRDLAIVA
jgi:Xaa-Pro aminopeptidase